MMRFLIFTCFAFIALIVDNRALHAVDKERMNVLFIAVDDLNAFTIGTNAADGDEALYTMTLSATLSGDKTEATTDSTTTFAVTISRACLDETISLDAGIDSFTYYLDVNNLVPKSATMTGSVGATACPQSWTITEEGGSLTSAPFTGWDDSNG
mgnify:CR=1 FL=1